MSVADGLDHPLDRRVIPLHRLTGWILSASVSLGLFIMLVSFLIAESPRGLAIGLLLLLWAAASATLAWWLQRWPAIWYRYASYKVDAQGVEIRRGVVWRSVVNVPRSRVQHTDVSQGPLERRFGLSTLIIHTAGTDHAMVSVNGLDHATALAIRDHLLPRESADAV